jgi:hypothetical protein
MWAVENFETAVIVGLVLIVALLAGILATLRRSRPP